MSESLSLALFLQYLASMGTSLARRVDMFARTEPVTSIRDIGAADTLRPSRIADAPGPHPTSTSSEAFESTIPFALIDPNNPADTLIDMAVAPRRSRYLGLSVAVVTACSLAVYFAML